VIDWTTKSWAVSSFIAKTKILKFYAGLFYVFGYVINQGSAYGAMADNPGLVIAFGIHYYHCFVLTLFFS
jgi:lipoprotein signal peptidase